MTLLNIEQDFCNLNDNMMQRLLVYNPAYLTAHTATAQTCLKYQIFQKQGKIGLFGIFGAGDLGKTYKCNKCGCKF